jgi:hypothetical protein
MKPIRLACVALLCTVASLARAQGDSVATPAAPAPAVPVAAAPATPVVLADIPPPPADKAQIVFLKPTRGVFGALIPGIYAMDGDTRQLLGVLDKQSRIAVEVAPGRHRFMANMGAFAHFLDADVEAGKRYFVLARFVYAQGYQLRPVRPGTVGDFDAGQPAFREALASTAIREVPAKTLAWFAKHDARSIAKAQAKGEETWARKTDAERAELMLRAADSL